MMEHVWTVICSRAVTDRDSNNVSLEGVLEQVTVVGEPTPNAKIPVSFDVMTLWSRRQPGVSTRGKVRVTFEFPSGKIFGSALLMDVDLTEYERFRSKFSFPALPVAEAGRHVVRIEYQNEHEEEWHAAAAVPLTISFEPRQEEVPKVEEG